MLKLLRSVGQKQVKSRAIPCCCNFSSEEANPKEKETVHPTLKTTAKSLQKRISRPTKVTKDDLKWRTSWNETKYQYYDTLRTFYSEKSNVNLMKFLQQPIDLSPSAIKKWWLKKKELHEIFLQQYIPQRTNILGPELACAHFIVYRGGAVKFHNEDKWIKSDEGYYSLPNTYQAGMYLQAIDCSEMQLRYDGLSNFRNLQKVEWLSLSGSSFIDDYCLDAITNIFSKTLVYLDLRDCPNVTERGLGALYKMNNLKLLYLDDLLKDTKYELTCLLLEELNRNLVIKSDVINFKIK
ncbi:distal membrane-arm assembly complex protein 2 [Euwallacea fornicatus]|uniref:distal membrane-arm assembly complex protein 2 n=1 Tax=Euwallacea fornicatus TaxID=995702 RepID=UPI00338F076A